MHESKAKSDLMPATEAKSRRKPPAPPVETLYWTVAEAAQRVGVCRNTMLKAISEMIVRADKAPPGFRHWRIPKATFDDDWRGVRESK